MPPGVTTRPVPKLRWEILLFVDGKVLPAGELENKLHDNKQQFTDEVGAVLVDQSLFASLRVHSFCCYFTRRSNAEMLR